MIAGPAAAQSASIAGTVRDETGGVLPGVSVELRGRRTLARVTVTDDEGGFSFEGVPPGRAEISFALVNFGAVRRDVVVPPAGRVRVDAVLRFVLSADVAVTASRTFSNLAEAEDPALNLIGVAQSASQGAVIGRQLEVRPVMRAGEVLESVPGMIAAAHSGEGKANQYYSRGFNLDHGTDFATFVAGVPVNMPSHGHGQGYSDLNFLIPELVSGIQYSKGPYFAEQGDFSTAGSATINYVNVLERPILRAGGGGQGYGRALAAASPWIGKGRLLGAVEVVHNDGPWVQPDDYRKVNAVARFSRGDAVNGIALTAMAYRATWQSSDQVPQRAVASGALGRFGTLDPSDGGETARFSAGVDWQRSQTGGATKIAAYTLASDLSLFSNFTYFLHDPVRGDQIEQEDTRLVSGLRVTDRRLVRWNRRVVQNSIGFQARHDAIPTLGLHRSERRKRLRTIRHDSVGQTSLALFVQNEIEWQPWLRTLAGLRADGYRFRVDTGEPLNGGTTHARILSPKGGLIVGPFRGTELYANAGHGFHSNDARGTTLTRDPDTGEAAKRVTPLARARGAELGARTVAIPRLQSTIALWTLALDSELVFVGDAGTTAAGRASRRHGIEIANYYSPFSWLTLEGDLAWSRARFAGRAPGGDRIPGSVRTVISGAATLDGVRGAFGSVRLRYFGPRPLLEDDSVRSAATTLVNLVAGYKLSERARLTVDIFNLLNATDSDIDYFYTSRLPGEPAEGVEDLHFHPALPRTARAGLTWTF
jgi:hypothetical protein